VTGLLYGLARLCVRRRFYVLGVWLVVTIALVVVSHRLGENTNDNLSLPGTDSQRATKALEKSFPDQANEIIAIGAAGDSVLVDFWLTGTHLGPLRTPKGEIAPTGKAFRVRMMASFEFEPGSISIVCERPYFDRRAVLTALGLG